MAEWREQQEAASRFEGQLHRPRFKSPSQLIPITNDSTPPCNLLTRPWAGLGPRGPMAEWRSVKQLKLKAIQRPMLKSPPSSSVGRRLSRVQWQSGGAEAASIEGHTQA
ncbi:unnamed protein product [Staurois parvus]|uniref:Uncharacterized protein n=1 Tax=Staurois parvus TaxID=386267 RepID=A0ABN9BBX9_9NEOB|nr:unnamed protein product [Staurois parvus]